MDNNATIMRIHKIIATEILIEMAKGNNISTLVNKKNIESLLNKLDQNQYYIIHSLLDGSNTSILIKRFEKNEQCIVKLNLFSLEDICNFNIELYKFGQTMTSSLVKRYAVLTRKNFWSSLNPVATFDQNKAKSKLAFLEKAILNKETFDQNLKQPNWSNTNKNHRIDIIYKNHQKIDQHFYLYFNNEREMDIGFAMALTHTKHKTDLIDSAKGIVNTIMISHMTYSIIKLVAMKNKIKNNKIAIGSFSNIIKADYTLFNQFATKLANSIKLKSDNQKEYKMYFSLKRIVKPLSSINSSKIKRVVKKDMTSCQYAIDVIKQHVLKTVRMSSLDNANTNSKQKRKCFSFNLIPNSFKFISGNTQDLRPIPSQVTMNKKQVSIDFNTNISLPLDKIINISNVIIHISPTETKAEQNGLMIYGPKIDNNKYLSFIYNDIPNEEYYEPEIAHLNYIGYKAPKPSKETTQVYLMQLFHAVISFDTISHLLKLSNNYNVLKYYQFYIEFTFDKTQKAKSELVYPVLYSNNKIVIEFNKEYYINRNMVNSNFDMKIQICIVPVDTLFESNMFNHKFILNYISSTQIAYANITYEDILLKKNEFVLSSGNNSRIMISFQLIETQGQTINYLQFRGKEYSIGSNIYYQERLTPDDIDKLNADPSVPSQIKKEYYSISKSSDGLFLLRPNNKIDHEIIQSAIASSEEIKGMYANNKHSYIPQCQFNNDNNQLVYKDKFIDVLVLCDFKGVNIKGSLLIKNYYSNEQKTIEYNAQNTKSLHCIQENMFNVINYNAVSYKGINNGKNYQWKIYLKLYNEYATEAFVAFLKKLRREASLVYYSSHVNDNPIDLNRFIAYQTKAIQSDIKVLSISFEKIEFKNTFNLTEDVQLMIRIKKNVVQSNNKHMLGKSLIESFNENPELNYTNSLLQRNEIVSLYNSVKELKNVSKALPKQLNLDKDSFNSNHKYINFINISHNEKTIALEVNCALDKIFTIEITLEGHSKKIVFVSNIDLDNIIKDNANADYYYLPLYPSSTEKNVIGIICIKLLCVFKEKENTTFDEEYKKTIEKALNKKAYLFEENLNKIAFSYYEPNILRRLMMIKINNRFNESFNNLIEHLSNIPIGSDLRLKCYEFMRDKYIRDCDDILKMNKLTDCNVNDLALDDYPGINRRKIACLNKYYVNKKRNQILSLYTMAEWEVALNKYMKFYNKTNTINNSSNKSSNSSSSLFNNFPSKNEILEIESSNYTLFNDIQNLIQMGLPTQECRRMVWNSLLEINALVKLTSNKLPGYDNGQNKSISIMKGEIYSYFDRVVKSKNHLSIIDSLIDNDSNLLTSNNSYTNFSIDLNQTKTISKCYFLWAELSISSTYFKEKKCVYFNGLLRLIQRLYNIFQSPSETFWYIIGLSQVIQLFRQPNPLYSSEMNYIGQYTLVTKLILESHCKSIYNKFYELDFPIDYFITRHFSTFYSDYFQTDLFMKIFDIMIFQSTIKPNKDPLHYLRFLCVIPIVLFQLNEQIILMARSVNELDSAFATFFAKTYNSNKFIEMIRNSIEKYFYQKNLLEALFPINKDNSWDLKRNSVEKELADHFNDVAYENKKYLKRIIEKNKTVIMIPNIVFENNYLKAVRDITSQSKSIDNQFSNFNNKSNGIKYQIKKIIILKYSSSLSFSFMANNEFYYQIIYSNSILSINEMKLSKKRVKLTFDNFLNILSLKTINESINDFTQYIMILLLNTSFQPICRFCINSNQLSFVPKVLQIESIDIEEDSPKIILNIAIMKYTSKIIDREKEELLHILFSRPYYLDNQSVLCSLQSSASTSTSSSTNSDYINKCLLELEPIIKLLNDEIDLLSNKVSIYSAIKEEIGSNCMSQPIFSISRSSAKVVQEILNSFIDKEISSIVVEWLKSSGKVSLEEILYSMILIDKDIISIDDKLHIIYKIAKVKCLYENDNYNSNIHSVSGKVIKEVIYSLFKRYMIYFTKNEADAMIEYLIKREKTNGIKYVIVYNQCNNKEIEDIISDKSIGLNSHSIQLLNIKAMNTHFYQDITSEFMSLIRNIEIKFGIRSFNQEITKIMISNIMTSHPDFQNRNFDHIRIEWVNDYIQDKLIYQYDFTLKKVKLITKYHKYDLSNNEDSVLMKTTNDLNIRNADCDNKLISFEQFKTIVYDLPYLSDLMRVSCSYSDPQIIQEDYIQCIEIVKVSIVLNSKLLFEVYFSNKQLKFTEQSSSSVVLHIDFCVSTLNSIRDLRNMIKNKLLYVSIIDNQNELMALFEDMFICSYYVKNSLLNSNEKIELNDALYTKILKQEKQKQIEISYEINTIQGINKAVDYNHKYIDNNYNGYAKYYYNNRDKTRFGWRKCRIEYVNPCTINRDYIPQCKVYFSCFQYKTPIIMKYNEVIQFRVN